jgi:imidazole glycerol-phosphate synthase subunit HisH
LIAIVDYGVGNLRSVERALAHVGATTQVTSDPSVLEDAEGIVLPGVGAFGPAQRNLAETGLATTLVELARAGKPLLGVCLGYQLMFEESEEGGRHRGLGLLPGRVTEVVGTRCLPVIGWARVVQTADSVLWQGIADGAYFYFVHSYAPEPGAFAIGCADHAPAAAGAMANVYGTQFHPEKSGANGLRLYANFLTRCRE